MCVSTEGLPTNYIHIRRQNEKLHFAGSRIEAVGNNVELFTSYLFSKKQLKVS